jgi:hypothetical protein
MESSGPSRTGEDNITLDLISNIMWLVGALVAQTVGIGRNLAPDLWLPLQRIVRFQKMQLQLTGVSQSLKHIEFLSVPTFRIVHEHI